MVDEGNTPYRPRRAIPVEFDDTDSDFDDDDAAAASEPAPVSRRGYPRDWTAHSAPTPLSAATAASAASATSLPSAAPVEAPVWQPSTAPTAGLGSTESATPQDRPGFAPPPQQASAPPPATVPPPPTPSAPPPSKPPANPPRTPAGTAATEPVGTSRRRPTLPGRGYQPRRSAASTSSAPVRSAHSAPARSAASAPARSRRTAQSPPTPASVPASVPAAPASAVPAGSRSSDHPLRRLTGRLGQRGLLIGAVAAGLVVVLAVVYSVWALGDRPTTTGTPSSSAPGSTGSSTGPSVDTSPIPARLMASTTQTKALLAGSSWKIVTDTMGVTDDSVTATCLGRSGEGEPVAEATRIRTLADDGADAPAVFHQADLYPTPADAIEAMTVRTKALGLCSTQFALLLGGAVGTDLGNSAIGVTVLIQDSPTSYHSVLINRTGRLVNVVDVASEDQATAASISMAKVGSMLGKVTDRQCSFAVGLCATNASVRETVPPIGDTPGLLSTADVPRVGTSTGVWTPGEPTRKPTVTGSNCEATDFTAVKGSTATLARTYILADDPGFFGFDTVLITMKSATAARDLADGISTKISDCQKRLLTADVSAEESFSGTGVRSAGISGETFVVTQKIDDGKTTLRYRVGVGAVGNKVIYSFANPKAKTDFTAQQWTDLNVRMGQRATQVN